MLRTFVLMLVLALPLLVAGCLAADAVETNDTAEGEGEGEDGDEDACAANDDSACGLCLQDNCCDALVACEGDADCLACVNGEDGDVCESDEDTHSRVIAYLECRGGPCQETCIGAASDNCRAPLQTAGVGDDCIACLESNCCAEVAACSTNDICWDGCFFNHVAETCHSDPDGHALYHSLGVCFSDAGCASVCS